MPYEKRVTSVGFALWCLLIFPASASSADLTFYEFYSTGFEWTTLFYYAAVAIASGALVYFTGGAATPIVSSIGTWIGALWGLKGAAATSFGLAMLGGGSLASGGFGMAGGAAVLTAAVKFSPAAAQIAYSYAYFEYDRRRFLERSSRMLLLPLPRADIGPEPHRDAVRIIQKHFRNYEIGKSPADIEIAYEANRSAVAAAIKLSDVSDLAGLPASVAAKVHTGRALLHLFMGDHASAKQSAEVALASHGLSDQSFRQTDVAPRGFSLPAAIWGIAALSDDKVDVDTTATAVLYSLAVEPDKQFAQVVVACYLDRLLLRNDALKPQHIRQIIQALGTHLADRRDERSRAAAMLVTVYKSFILLKLNQDFITTISDLPEFASLGERTRARKRRALAIYTELLSIISDALVAIRATDGFFMASIENRNQIGEITEQLEKYAAFEPELRAKATAP